MVCWKHTTATDLTNHKTFHEVYNYSISAVEF